MIQQTEVTQFLSTSNQAVLLLYASLFVFESISMIANPISRQVDWSLTETRSLKATSRINSTEL